MNKKINAKNQREWYRRNGFMHGAIYKIINNITGDYFIGSTVKPLGAALRQHIYLAVRRGSNAPLHEAMRKYGEKNFSVELHYECEYFDDRVLQKEMFVLSLKPAYNNKTKLRILERGEKNTGRSNTG
jgi:hypothetical protein